MDLQFQWPSIGFDHGVTVAAQHLPAGVVATQTTDLG